MAKIKTTHISKHFESEVERAGKFMSLQLLRGWNVIEVFEQIKNSFGGHIHDALILSLKRINKKI